MKRFALVLSALALIGAQAFADPALAFSSYVNSGIQVVHDGNTTTAQSYANDWGTTGTIATLGASLTTDNAGFSVTVDVASEDGVSTDTAYGWVSPAAGLKLFAGTGYNGAFDGVDDNSADYVSAHGLTAAYSIAGLTIGGSSVLSATATDEPRFGAGLAYSLDKVATFKASATSVGTGSAAASVSVSAVPGLTLAAGFASANLDGATNDLADLVVGYALTKAVSVKVTAYDYLTDDYFTVTPKVAVTLTPAASAYAQVKVVTGDAATYVPKVGASYVVGAATIGCYVAYDTDATTTTGDVDFVFSF